MAWLSICLWWVTLQACEKKTDLARLPVAPAAQSSTDQAEGNLTLRARPPLEEKSERPQNLPPDPLLPFSAGSAAEHDAKSLAERVKEQALERLRQGQEESGDDAPAPRALNSLVDQGRTFWQQGRTPEAQESMLAACQRGLAEGCHKFAWLEEHTGNQRNAQRFYLLACNQGLQKSCNNLGFLFERQTRWDEALDSYARACLARHDRGCANLKRLRAERLRLR